MQPEQFFINTGVNAGFLAQSTQQPNFAYSDETQIALRQLNEENRALKKQVADLEMELHIQKSQVQALRDAMQAIRNTASDCIKNTEPGYWTDKLEDYLNKVSISNKDSALKTTSRKIQSLHFHVSLLYTLIDSIELFEEKNDRKLQGVPRTLGLMARSANRERARCHKQPAPQALS